LPDGMGENCGCFCFGPIVGWRKVTAENRFDTERREEVVRDPGGINLLGKLATFSGDVVVLKGRNQRHLRQASRRTFPNKEAARVDRHELIAVFVATKAAVNGRELRRFVVGQRIEQY